MIPGTMTKTIAAPRTVSASRTPSWTKARPADSERLDGVVRIDGDISRQQRFVGLDQRARTHYADVSGFIVKVLDVEVDPGRNAPIHPQQICRTSRRDKDELIWTNETAAKELHCAHGTTRSTWIVDRWKSKEKLARKGFKHIVLRKLPGAFSSALKPSAKLALIHIRARTATRHSALAACTSTLGDLRR
jgi:hypothetical protein